MILGFEASLIPSASFSYYSYKSLRFEINVRSHLVSFFIFKMVLIIADQGIVFQFVNLFVKI